MSHSFRDKNQGVAAYGFNRLIRTTNGGGLTECVTGINNTENNPALTIYPNPNQGSFTIELPTNEPYTVTVIDLNGKIISTSKNQGEQMQISGLGNGVYVLRLHTKAYTYYQKIIVAQ